MSNSTSGLLGLYTTFLNQDERLKTKKVTDTAALLRSSTPTTARLENDEVGKCPYCGTRMTVSAAANETVYLCSKDRYVAPRPNAELPGASNT